ncbi:MAG: GNAT family N-acetyltransferase [Bacteroidales bacterium]|nr:GNAT family N-acetyltransferase [Bacteroidales bacterium]
MIENENILLRAPELEDLDQLFLWENDASVRLLSNAHTPVSRFSLEQYILSAKQDIYEAKQARFMAVEKKQDRLIGHIDLFDFDPHHRRAGVGIMVIDSYRIKGYAAAMLQLIINYCAAELEMHQLFCNIAANNQASLRLFTKAGFAVCGEKKEWLRYNKTWINEYILQHFL